MRSLVIAILGVVLGLSMMIMTPAFADTSSSSSFILTDSFSIVGSPSDTSTSFTQKGAGGFGAKPVSLKPVSTSSNQRSHAITVLRTTSITPSSEPVATITQAPTKDTGTSTSQTSTDPSHTPSPDASTPLQSNGGSSVLDRVIDTLNAARQAIIAPFQRSPSTETGTTPQQPTVVAVSPQSERSTGASQGGAGSISSSASSTVTTPTPVNTQTQPLETPTTSGETVKDKTSAMGHPVQQTVVAKGGKIVFSAVRRVTTAVAQSVVKVATFVKEKTVQGAHATFSWFQWIWDTVSSLL